MFFKTSFLVIFVLSALGKFIEVTSILGLPYMINGCTGAIIAHSIIGLLTYTSPEVCSNQNKSRYISLNHKKSVEFANAEWAEQEAEGQFKFDTWLQLTTRRDVVCTTGRSCSCRGGRRREVMTQTVTIISTQANLQRKF